MGIGEVVVGWLPIASAAGKVGKPTSILEESVALISQEGEHEIDAVVERPRFEHDDDLEISSNKPLSRCVFGGPPTLREVKATTSELTDALELEKISENEPNHASRRVMKCVELLTETPEYQDVFESIASDPNVYNAMLNNPAVTDYVMRWHKTNVTPSIQMASSLTERISEVDFICDEHLKNSSLLGKLRDLVKDLARIAKTRVVEMVSYLSKLFGTSSDVHVDHPNDKSAFTDVHASLAWFALVVIVLVVFKRKI